MGNEAEFPCLVCNTELGSHTTSSVGRFPIAETTDICISDDRGVDFFYPRAWITRIRIDSICICYEDDHFCSEEFCKEESISIIVGSSPNLPHLFRRDRVILIHYREQSSIPCCLYGFYECLGPIHIIFYICMRDEEARYSDILLCKSPSIS